MADLELAAARAVQALDLGTRQTEPDEPFVGTILRARERHGLSANPSRLFQHWSNQSVGSEVSDLRYPWLLSHERFVDPPPYAGEPESWSAWRASEADLLKNEPYKLENRLSVPLVLANNLELLIEALDGPHRPEAESLLTTVHPRARRDFASFVQATGPWADTFALWCLASSPVVFQRLRPIALAVAVSYAEIAGACDGVVKGSRFPFRNKHLCSASAHLALGLFKLGLDLPLVARLVSFLRSAQRSDGGWGDGDDPSDVLTTLVVGELLARLVPGLEMDGMIDFLVSRQEESGWWSALGPEKPWLTSQVLDLLKLSSMPFAQRFSWPPVEPSERDPKTGLARFSYFVGLAELFARLPELGGSRLQLGFLDLAKFKRFNDTYGQDEGDRVLRVLAEHLSSYEGMLTVRDGGDEYLLLGAPTDTGLEGVLERARQEWPAVFFKNFGADAAVVAPRILVGETEARGLMKAREELGKGITGLKGEIPGAEGILKTVDLVCR